MEAWEACKENVLPSKNGRSVKTLNENLDKPLKNSTIEKVQETVFENKLNESGRTPSEVLDTYVSYIKWVKETYPTNSEKTLKLLEKSTSLLKDHEELKNDIRFVKLWIEYADLVKAAGDIFSFMHQNKIGEKVALFWIAWAFIAEKADNFKLADQIFQKGIRRQAEPKDQLSKRYQQFQRRMARYFLNQSEAQLYSNDIPSTTTTTTTTTGGSSTGNNNNNNNNRQGSIESRHALSSLSKTQVVSGYRATNTHTNQTAPLIPPKSSLTSRTTHTSSTRPLPMNANTNANRQMNFTIMNDVIEDNITGTTMDPLDHPLLSTTEHIQWTNAPNDVILRKENEAPINKWSEGPLYPPQSNSTASNATVRNASTATSRNTLSQFTTTVGAGSSGISSIPIFVDEEDDGDSVNDINDRNADADVEEDVISDKNKKKTGLSIRQMLDAPVEKTSSTTTTATTTTSRKVDKHGYILNDMEYLNQDPLRAHKTTLSSSLSTVSSSIPHKQDTTGATTTMEHTVKSSNPSHISIKAKADITSLGTSTNDSSSQILSSSTVKQPNIALLNTQKVSSTLVKPTSFSIFSDEMDFDSEPNYNDKKTQTQIKSHDEVKSTKEIQLSSNRLKPVVSSMSHSSTNATVMATNDRHSGPKSTDAKSSVFNIFQDDVDDPPSKKLSPSQKSLLDTKSKLRVSQPTSIIPIFEDNNDTVKGKNLSSVHKVDTVSNTTAAKSLLGNVEDNHDVQLNDILNTLGILDGEDTTINTKLAKKDIDSMFCSPMSNDYFSNRDRMDYDEDDDFSMKKSITTKSSHYDNTKTTSYTLKQSQTTTAMDSTTTHSTSHSVYDKSSNKERNYNHEYISGVKRPLITNSVRHFGASDLSAIKEVSYEDSMCGILPSIEKDRHYTTHRDSTSTQSYHSSSSNSNSMGLNTSDYMIRLEMDHHHPTPSNGCHSSARPMDGNPPTTTTTTTTNNNNTRMKSSSVTATKTFTIFED